MIWNFFSYVQIDGKDKWYDFTIFQKIAKIMLTNCGGDAIISDAGCMQKEANGLISKLKTGKTVVGLKQTKKAAAQSQAEMVWIAEDADPALTAAVERVCQEHQVPVEWVPTMKELGSACGISVGASAAALLRF